MTRAGYRAAGWTPGPAPARSPRRDALFAANDVMAIGAMGAARELGLSVPGDLSIIGYDDTFLARTR